MGPSCWDEAIISDLVTAGMNVARLNFSHGDHESHARTIENVRKVEEKLRRPIATLIDTKGPEIRTGMLVNNEKVLLNSGDEFYLYFVPKDGTADGVYVDYVNLYKEVPIGQEIFIDDGSIVLSVEEIDPSAIRCRVLVGGELGEKKGINVPGLNFQFQRSRIKISAIFDGE